MAKQIAQSDMLERHIKIALQMQGKAIRALQLLPAERLSAHDVLKFISEATRIERECRDLMESVKIKDKSNG